MPVGRDGAPTDKITAIHLMDACAEARNPLRSFRRSAILIVSLMRTVRARGRSKSPMRDGKRRHQRVTIGTTSTSMMEWAS